VHVASWDLDGKSLSEGDAGDRLVNSGREKREGFSGGLSWGTDVASEERLVGKILLTCVGGLPGDLRSPQAMRLGGKGMW